MWWNFVGRTTEEIVTARNAWATGEFGEVRGYPGDPLPAPPLPPGELKARLGNVGGLPRHRSAGPMNSRGDTGQTTCPSRLRQDGSACYKDGYGQ